MPPRRRHRRTDLQRRPQWSRSDHPECRKATQDDGTIVNLCAGQLTVFGPFTSDNPIDVFLFEWNGEAPGEVSYETQSWHAGMWVDEDKESADLVEAAVLNEVAFGWTVVSCEADVNADATLDILDFIAFQIAWQAEEPIADCDANGAFEMLDFVCFQRLFVAGCP